MICYLFRGVGVGCGFAFGVVFYSFFLGLGWLLGMLVSCLWDYVLWALSGVALLLFGCVLLLIFRSAGSFTSVLSVCVWWCYCFILIGFRVCLLAGLGGLV